MQGYVRRILDFFKRHLKENRLRKLAPDLPYWEVKLEQTERLNRRWFLISSAASFITFCISFLLPRRLRAEFNKDGATVEEYRVAECHTNIPHTNVPPSHMDIPEQHTNATFDGGPGSTLGNPHIDNTIPHTNTSHPHTNEGPYNHNDCPPPPKDGEEPA